jgi:hypothetical protein
MTWLRRRWAVVSALALLLAGALTTASLAARGGTSASRAALAQTQPEEEDAGVHGGPNARFHNAGACPLPAGAKVQGNWTHGDYVTAWAEADPTKVRDAAHSACGKPAHVAGKGAKPGKAARKAGRPGKIPTPEPQPPGSS